VQAARTRRWLGLTATPYRRGKLEALIAFQCGPTRHEIKPGAVHGTELARRELVVHHTATEVSEDVATHIQQVFGEIVADQERTAQAATTSTERPQRGARASCSPSAPTTSNSNSRGWSTPPASPTCTTASTGPADPPCVLASCRDDEPGLQLVDVRNPSEQESGIVPAVRLPLARLLDRHGDLDAAAPTVVYCAAGYRSSMAASLLRSVGFTHVADLQGGYDAWADAGLPTVTPQTAG
jgi:rhodanese-related sulfurtransferase